MTVSGKPQEFEIGQLVELFRRALVAVGPIVEQAGVNWLQDPPYDDWEAACDGLFQSVVLSAVGNSNVAGQIGAITRHGFHPEHQDAHLGVQIDDDEFAFVRFAGKDRDVGTVILLNLSNTLLEVRPWKDCSVFLRLSNGTRITQIEVDQ